VSHDRSQPRAQLETDGRPWVTLPHLSASLLSAAVGRRGSLSLFAWLHILLLFSSSTCCVFRVLCYRRRLLALRSFVHACCCALSVVASRLSPVRVSVLPCFEELACAAPSQLRARCGRAGRRVMPELLTPSLAGQQGCRPHTEIQPRQVPLQRTRPAGESYVRSEA